MSDILRIITFSPGGRPIEVLNVNSDPGAVTAYFRERNTFKFTPAPSSVQYSKRVRRYGGGRAVGQTHDNAAISWTAYVRGSTLAAATANVEALIKTIEDAARGRYVEWAPEGGLSSYFEIAGPGTWDPTYDPVEFVQTNAMRVQLVFPVLPLVQWARMTALDPFDVNSASDYTFDAMTSAAAVITGGVVTASGGSLSSERRTRYTARGYDLLEGEAVVKFTTGATLSGFKAGVTLRASASNTYWECYIDDDGTNSRRRIDSVIGGVRTNRASSNLSLRLSTNTTYWVRGRIESNAVIIEFFPYEPSPMDPGDSGASINMNSGDAPLNTTPGKAGWSWVPQSSAATLDDFQWRPYTYFDQSLPHHFITSDAIPGNAPALADVRVTTSGGATAAKWGMVAWCLRPDTYSFVQNGYFEDDPLSTTTPAGWSTAAVTNINGAASGMTAESQSGFPGGAKYGDQFGLIGTSGVIGSGANYRLHGRFVPGRTYVLEAWLRASSTLNQVQVRLGSASGDLATSTASALTTTHTLYTVSWTPFDVREDVYLSIIASQALATNIHVDAVRVYTGTAPVGYQEDGRGAYPPFGIIEAEAGRDLVGWVNTAAAGTTRGDRQLRDGTVSGAETYQASFVIDPGLIASDDFTDSELNIEVWARLEIDAGNITPTITSFVASSEDPTFIYSTARYTNEWGSAGHIVTKPSSGSAWRFTRVGTLTVRADRNTRRPLKLYFGTAMGGGSTGAYGIDYLLLVPARNRALGPTSKVYDGGYPVFTRTIFEVTRTIKSDLSGFSTQQPGTTPIADHGLGGSLIEIPPGLVHWLVKLSSLVPDDPTVSTSTEQLAHGATLQIDVTPRSYMLRTS